MKRIYVNEKWCLGCKLCEYNCAFANTNMADMAEALKGVVINPRIKIEQKDDVSFAVSCRHCEDPLCVKSCITGALSIKDGVICVDKSRCVGCYTCIMACPFGSISISPDEGGVIQKCELCLSNTCGEPACVKGCPNGAIVYEER